MEKKKFSFDLGDYDDEIFNDVAELVDESLELDSTEDYNDFNSIIEVDDSDDVEIDDIEDSDKTSQYNEKALYAFDLSIFYSWFTRIGMGIAVILMALFITRGEFFNLFKYILLLVGSFFVGYFVMYLYDKIRENN